MAAREARFEHVQAHDYARQHLGDNYNYTTNNNGFFHVPKKPPNEPVHADLIRACAEGARTPRLHYLLSQGANIDHRDAIECTPLHHAAFGGSMETTRAIVNAGADVNAANDWFGTPLCLAAIRRDLAAVEFLIEHNASVAKDCNMLESAAHAACAGGDIPVIQALHAAGADFKVSKVVRVSALCCLSRLSQDGKGLGTGLGLSRSGCQSQSPGAVAVRFRHCEAVDFCLGLAKGLLVDELWKILSITRTLLGSFTQNSWSGNGMSLLSLAMSTLDIRTAESLLNHGARDSVLDPFGRGALACALDAIRLQTTNEVYLDSAVKLLIRYGVDINGLCCPGRWPASKSEKFFAAWKRDYTSERLVEYQALIWYGRWERGTALMYTIRHWNNHRSLAHCIEVLISNGAKADVRDKNGDSALSLARVFLHGNKRIEVEKIFLRHNTTWRVENDDQS